jgi:hypothetical protein
MRTLNGWLCLVALGLLGFGAQSAAGEQKAADTPSALARLAASLKPGTWALLNKDGDESGYGAKFTDSGVGGLFGYASKAA